MTTVCKSRHMISQAQRPRIQVCRPLTGGTGRSSCEVTSKTQQVVVQPQVLSQNVDGVRVHMCENESREQ